MHLFTRLSLMCLLVAVVTTRPAAAQEARGTVFDDRNGNGMFDGEEPGLPGVHVSNGRDVATTDEQGRWALPVSDDAILFVIKPSGWAVSVDRNRVPRYYYIHKPQGSPAVEPAGVAPTGPLPDRIDFPLTKAEEPRDFNVVFFADPQARGLKEVNYVAHDVVEELVGTDAVFGVTLGDLVADDPGLFEAINEAVGHIGIPWYSVIGNHDSNRGTREDRHSDETFERVYGPATYAFEYGDAVFIGLDDVYVKPEGGYEGRFTDDQLAFVKAYLGHVPEGRLVVLMMHIPIHRCKNVREMLSLLAGRPNTFSISGHAHEQSHRFLGEQEGWPGPTPHHHFVCGAVSGSWWCGMIDETGIPHATMNDGVPNGYCVLEVKGNTYALRYKAARRPADYQMNVYLPDEIEAAQAGATEVLVNVFAGSDRSKVEMRVDENGPWTLMTQTVGTDPECQRMHEASAEFTQEMETRLGWKMDPPSRTGHLWKAALPSPLAPGNHVITVRTTDMFGEVYEAHRILRVR